MADVIRKRVTLHPLKKNGQMDLNVNLYPKCFVDGIVDRNGNPVNVVVSNEPGVSIEQVVTQLEAEIAEHGGVTPEDLEEALQGYATVEVVDSIAGHVSDLAGELGTVSTTVSQLETDKQDVIADLDSIRAGAAAGATSVQPSTLDNYATLNDISDLVDEEQVEYIVETAFEEMLEDDTYFATADDIYAAYHILNIENQEIEGNTMVLGEDDFVDEEEHLADLDVELIPLE